MNNKGANKQSKMRLETASSIVFASILLKRGPRSAEGATFQRHYNNVVGGPRPHSRRTQKSCYSNARDINMKELSLIQAAGFDNSKLSNPRNYVLCPNTVFPVGFNVDYNDTHLPLAIFNPNVHIQCGETGSSRNSCIFQGGDVQVIGLDASDLPSDYENLIPDASNLTLRGVTFQNAVDVLSMEIPGQNILIQDCHFRGHKADSVVHFRYDSPFGASSPVSATIQDCTFTDNTADSGIIETNDDVWVSISNCMFSSNVVTGDQYSDNGILRLRGAGGNVSNCCFVNNTFPRAAIWERETQYTYSGNYGANNSVPEDDTGCAGISDASSACTNFDSQVCNFVDPIVLPPPDESFATTMVLSSLCTITCASAVAVVLYLL